MRAAPWGEERGVVVLQRRGQSRVAASERCRQVEDKTAERHGKRTEKARRESE